MGAVVMLTGIVISLVAGLLSWSWLSFFAGAALWTMGYFIEKPGIARHPQGGMAVSLVGQVMGLNIAVCALIYLAGCVMEYIWILI